MGQAERTGRKDRQNKTAMIAGQDGQDCTPNRAAKIGLPAQDCWDNPAREEQKAKDSQNSQTGQPEWDRHNRTGKIRLPGKICQVRIARTGHQDRLPAQDC